MLTIFFGAIGLLVFIAGTLVLGLRLRRAPAKANAEQYSRIMHFLFFAGLGAPFMLSLVYPGVLNLDATVGLNPLPFRPLTLLLGTILAVPGLYFLGSSNKLLRALGSGANAFRLTQRVVAADVYQYTRNPMSLGYYCATLGLSLLIGSTVLTMYVLLGLIPAHLFFLKYFEEQELELRLGQSYLDYKQRVAFLIPRII